MSTSDKLAAAQACYKILMNREAQASFEQSAQARAARQQMQVHIGEIRRSMRDKK